MRVGLAWYHREDYPRILDMMADRSDLHDTYDEWLRDAERVEKHLAREGHTMMRVFIDPEGFRTWCEQHNLKPVAGARSQFTSEAARAMSENEGRS